MENYHGHMEIIKDSRGRIRGVLELPKKEDGKRKRHVCYGDPSKSDFEQWKEIVNRLNTLESKG